MGLAVCMCACLPASSLFLWTPGTSLPATACPWWSANLCLFCYLAAGWDACPLPPQQQAPSMPFLVPAPFPLPAAVPHCSFPTAPALTPPTSGIACCCQETCAVNSAFPLVGDTIPSPLRFYPAFPCWVGQVQPAPLGASRSSHCHLCHRPCLPSPCCVLGPLLPLFFLPPLCLLTALGEDAPTTILPAPHTRDTLHTLPLRSARLAQHMTLYLTCSTHQHLHTLSATLPYRHLPQTPPRLPYLRPLPAEEEETGGMPLPRRGSENRRD